MPLQIKTFSCRSDNFGFLAHDEATGETAAIDAPHAGPIIDALEAEGWRLTHLLITHHHADHTEGLAELKAKYGCTAYGPMAEVDRIAGLDELLDASHMLDLGETRLEIIETPGHTLGHICYFDPTGLSLFCGDALFSLGCGRMFEGSPEPMWEGLKRLRALPDETMVHCGHEYTIANARFAMSIDPDNGALKRRAAEAQTLRDAGKATVPFRLGDDKKANPFLRADDPGLMAKMGMAGAQPFEVFAAIRKAKDSF
ncbi:MAG: hydroxyacylglutathione hydrolase [Hyphomicrobiaceae bacterium]|nr:hydroxyacylglutathione hydrolase [Hyphomicrobiaceae bacterium]